MPGQTSIPASSDMLKMTMTQSVSHMVQFVCASSFIPSGKQKQYFMGSCIVRRGVLRDEKRTPIVHHMMQRQNSVSFSDVKD